MNPERFDASPFAASRRRGGAWRLVRRAGAVLCLSGLVLVVAGYARFASGIAGMEPASVPRTDGIVVVTGGSQRVGDALGLLDAERGARLLISGVNEKTGREELAKLNPAGRELIACCVDLDYRARNTIGNAIEARRWLKRHRFRSVLLVTSNYHMPRTLLEFAHAMPDVAIIPHPVVGDQGDVAGWWYDWRTLKLLVPEYGKYLAAGLRGLVEGDPETSRLSVIIGGRKPVSPRQDGAGPVENPRRSSAPTTSNLI